MSGAVALLTASLATLVPAQLLDVRQPINAQIVVTISPEARVSAVVGAPLPRPVVCGSAMELNVRLINRAFVTAPLRAEIIGDGARLVALQTGSEKLSGKSEDARLLRLTPYGPDAADITIVFTIDNNIGDLGGLDRVHLLIRCLMPSGFQRLSGAAGVFIR